MPYQPASIQKYSYGRLFSFISLTLSIIDSEVLPPHIPADNGACSQRLPACEYSSLISSNIIFLITFLSHMHFLHLPLFLLLSL